MFLFINYFVIIQIFQILIYFNVTTATPPPFPPSIKKVTTLEDLIGGTTPPPTHPQQKGGSKHCWLLSLKFKVYLEKFILSPEM